MGEIRERFEIENNLLTYREYFRRESCIVWCESVKRTHGRPAHEPVKN